MNKKFLILFLIFIISGIIFMSCSDDDSSTTPTPDPPITVTSPNGGEVVQMGTSVTISWEDYDGDSIKIELYKSGVFSEEIEASYPNTGSYTSDIPTDLVEGCDYKIKITCKIDTSIFDYSDADFIIAPVGEYIIVTFPNGGDTWYAGTTRTITWEDNIDEDILISFYYQDDWLSESEIQTASDGSFDYPLPQGIPSSNNYKIKITSVANSSIFDFSDTGFTVIPEGYYILVTSPNGGETWYAGTTQTITWEDNIEEDVMIFLSDMATFVEKISLGTESDGSFEYNIPLDVPVGDNLRVIVMSVGDYETDLADYSDSNFTIVPVDYITLTSPNGGEAWKMGTSQIIAWEDYDGDSVKIELYKSEIFSAEIETSYPNTGSYTFDIPTDIVADSDYKVKVTSTTDTTVYDFSDSDFEIILADYITITYPTGGETWEMVESYSITWEDNIDGDVVISMYYDEDNNGQWVLERSWPQTESDGSFLLSPGTVYSGIYCIEIVSLDNPNVRDSSGSFFIEGIIP